MEHLDFPSFLHERLRARGFTLKKLAEVSGITSNHLQALADGDFSKLPAAPYLHGYLITIGRVLEFDPGEWWLHFKAEGLVPRSGREDRLPQNRFAVRPVGTWGWAAIIGIVLLGYIGFRFTKIIGRPTIEVLNPEADLTSTSEGALTLTGRLKNGDQLLLNGETITPGTDGSWEKRVLLQPGLNTFVLSAKKFLGQETEVSRQVVYEPPARATVPSSSPPEEAPAP